MIRIGFFSVIAALVALTTPAARTQELDQVLDALSAAARDPAAAPAPPPVATAGEMRIGRATRGSLSRQDPVDASGRSYDTYTLRAEAGQAFHITLDAGFDAYLRVTSPNGAVFTDDDSGDSLNAALDVATPVAGEFQVTATSYGEASGRYQLRAVAVDAATVAGMAPVVAVLETGANPGGTLQAGDPRRQNGAYAEPWLFRGHAGQQIEIRMQSPTFDNWLIVTGPNGFTQENRYDPLSPEPLRNARLTLTLPADGDYRIEAGAAQPDVTGAYRLQVVDEAIAAQERAAIMARLPEIFRQADAYLDAGDNANAIAWYTYGIQLDDRNAQARNNRGVAYLRQNNLMNARWNFEDALIHDPNNRDAQNNLVAVQQREQQQQQQQAAQQAQQSAAERQAASRLIMGGITAALGGNAAQIGQALAGQQITVPPPPAPPTTAPPIQQASQTQAPASGSSIYYYGSQAGCISFRKIASTITADTYEVRSLCPTEVYYSIVPVGNTREHRDSGFGGRIASGQVQNLRYDDPQFRNAQFHVIYACMTNPYASTAVGVQLRSLNFDYQRGECAGERAPTGSVGTAQ